MASRYSNALTYNPLLRSGRYAPGGGGAQIEPVATVRSEVPMAPAPQPMQPQAQPAVSVGSQPMNAGAPYDEYWKRNDQGQSDTDQTMSDPTSISAAGIAPASSWGEFAGNLARGAMAVGSIALGGLPVGAGLIGSGLYDAFAGRVPGQTYAEAFEIGPRAPVDEIASAPDDGWADFEGGISRGEVPGLSIDPNFGGPRFDGPMPDFVTDDAGKLGDTGLGAGFGTAGVGQVGNTGSGGWGGYNDSGQDGGGGYGGESGTGQGNDSSGYQAGGYTGAGADGVVQPWREAGVVHEGEHVAHADATAYYGRNALTALNERRIPRSALNALVRRYS